MKKLSQAIILGAKLYEQSYDHKKSKELETTLELADYNTYYKMTLKDACDEASETVGYDTRGTEPVYLLLKNSWNDCIAWAEHYND